MNLSLDGKTALVCGSSQGIGFSVAEELALMGANCILLARNESSLRSAAALLDTSLRQMHSWFVADFSETETLRRVVKEITSLHTIHILINNTGGPKPGPVTEATESQFLDAFRQHVIANHLLTQAVLPGMKKDTFGRIVNIISTSVKIPLHNLGVSNTIRAAVASWAKTMSNELAGFNITVNSVLPGYTETQRLASLIESNVKKENSEESVIVNRMISEIPAKRFGSVSEIASLVAFLSSPAASYINGVSIPVDGGRTGTI